MDFQTLLASLQSSGTAVFPAEAGTLDYARKLDAQEPVRALRNEFIFPTKGSLRQTIAPASLEGTSEEEKQQPLVYFCGNSLGLQPKALRASIDQHLATWAAVGVYGHFHAPPDSPLAPWQDMSAACAAQMAPLVGAASPDEVVAMNTLTVNLHLLLASFYQPTAARHKILLEWKPFPSDYYAIESHIRMRGFDPAVSMVELQPDVGPESNGHYISTAAILAAIDEHADDAALLLLPGIQYYSGQLFDIPTITRHAHARGLVVGWDLAHAAGNVPLHMHDWDVDFAAWCTYKYLNAGPGSMSGAFIHERHGTVTTDPATGKFVFRNRLSGWYGADKSVRFNMAKEFQPTIGAGGFQLSNPSVIDLVSLHGALSVLEKNTSMDQLRQKSLVLTAYAEWLLDSIAADEKAAAVQAGRTITEPPFTILTPRNPAERGAQLSVLLRKGLLEKVGSALEAAGVICDQRKPDVIRVAPVPMYNSFEDVWTCVGALRKAILAL